MSKVEFKSQQNLPNFKSRCNLHGFSFLLLFSEDENTEKEGKPGGGVEGEDGDEEEGEDEETI